MNINMDPLMEKIGLKDDNNEDKSLTKNEGDNEQPENKDDVPVTEEKDEDIDFSPTSDLTSSTTSDLSSSPPTSDLTSSPYAPPGASPEPSESSAPSVFRVKDLTVDKVYKYLGNDSEGGDPLFRQVENGMSGGRRRRRRGTNKKRRHGRRGHHTRRRVTFAM